MKTIPVRKIVQTLNVGRFSIRDLKQVLNGNDLVHDLHKHDFFFVLALHKGKGFHEIDFIKYEIQDHSVFILRPGQVHRLELNAESTGFLMEFDLFFYQAKNTITDKRWKKASGRNYCKTESEGFLKMHSTLSNVFEEFTTKREGYIEAIKANLDLFFIEYIRQSLDPQTNAQANIGYTQDRYEEFIGLLEANIAHMKNVTQYAGLLSLSSYQLNAITKRTVGKTVSDLINEQIILEAKRYLLATSGQIKDIGDHLGYEDVSYFIRFFKKHTGHSPEAFRKNFK